MLFFIGKVSRDDKNDSDSGTERRISLRGRRRNASYFPRRQNVGALKSKERLEAAWLRWESMKYTGKWKQKEEAFDAPRPSMHRRETHDPSTIFSPPVAPALHHCPAIYTRLYIYGIEDVSATGPTIASELNDSRKNNNSIRIELIFPKCVKKMILFLDRLINIPEFYNLIDKKNSILDETE